MKSAVETLSPTRVKLTVELPFSDLQPSLDAAYKRIAGQVNIPGFRRGRVPARVIDQRIGRGAVLEEAVNEALPRAYDEAVRGNDLVPVGRPDVEVTQLADGEQVTFTAEVDVRPEFDVPSYEGLRVEVAPAEASDEEIDEQLDALRTRFATFSAVERPAQPGDVLLVDLAGTAAGVEVDDLAATALSYEVGGDELLPGLDEAVAGASAGEERTFAFTPEAGQWEGRPLDVRVTVKAVRERALPPADDDFAQLASEFDAIDELRADLRTRIERVKRLQQGSEARTKVHEALLALVDIPIPERAVADELAEHFSDGHGDPDHRSEVEDNARASLKSQFVLDKIADTEELGVAQEELSAWLVQQAPRYGMTPDALAQTLMQSGQVAVAVADVRRSKALAHVLEAAEVVDTRGATVDLRALDEDLARLRREAPGAPGASYPEVVAEGDA